MVDLRCRWRVPNSVAYNSCPGAPLGNVIVHSNCQLMAVRGPMRTWSIETSAHKAGVASLVSFCAMTMTLRHARSWNVEYYTRFYRLL